MAKNELNELWSTLAQKVLASILVDDGAIFAVRDILGTHLSYFPTRERPIFGAVLECLSANTPPTVEAVCGRLDGTVPGAYVQTLAGQFNDTDNRHLIYNAEQLRGVGILMRLKAAGRDLSGISQVDDIDGQIAKISTKIEDIISGLVHRDSNGSVVADLAWAQIEKTKGLDCIPTGWRWFDILTGGLWPGMNYWIAAPYKSGKTTTMRNAVLESARLNIPVGCFCAEGSREMFILDCQAMIATSLLLDAGYRGDSLRLSGIFIRRFYWETGVMKKYELDAINEAREIWKMYPVHIWDAKDGITNLSTLRYLVKRGRVHDGIKSFWADYAGLFGGNGTVYERAAETARTVQNIASIEDVAFCMLAQQNEDHIRHGKGSYSPGIKGGGDASAAADFVLIPTRDTELKYLMKLKLHFSRHTDTGEFEHFIIPSCGLIADRWKDKQQASPGAISETTVLA